MTTRPFRHLCPEADLRDAMSDDEFWDHVFNNLMPNSLGFDDEGPPRFLSNVEPCPLCGEPGACAFDSEGRPMIHAVEEGEQSE